MNNTIIVTMKTRACNLFKTISCEAVTLFTICGVRDPSFFEIFDTIFDSSFCSVSIEYSTTSKFLSLTSFEISSILIKISSSSLPPVVTTPETTKLVFIEPSP